MPSRSRHRPPASRPSLLARVAAVVAVLAALGFAATLVGQPGEPGTGPPMGIPRTAVVLGADALTGALLGAGAVLLVLAGWALATSPRRRLVTRRPWWHTMTAIALLGLVTILLASSMRSGWLEEGLSQFTDGGSAGGPRELDPLAGPGAGDDLDPSVRQGAAIVGVVLVLLGSAVAAWWWLYRTPDDEVEGAAEAAATERLAAAVDAALGDLEGDLDSRRAILRCYAHLEAALAACGVRRRAAETAREHRHRAAGTLGPGARAAARLVDRFERARYDAVPVTGEDRLQAEAALREVREALGRHGVATAPAGPGRLP